MPWKKHSLPYSAEKLLIPLPVPHPAHIAVTIYNRDADEPISLESDICQSILRGIEESLGCLHNENGEHNKNEVKCVKFYSLEAVIGRCRGGGYEAFETASSSSETIDSHQTGTEDAAPPKRNSTDGVYQWTLNNWGQRKRKNSGSVRVDLASPEDVTLDSDSTRVVFSTYGTTV